jgi:cell division septation protein DedD
MRKSQSGWLAAPVLCLGLLLAGCSHVADDWKQAQAANSTEAYQEFLRVHPDSEFSKDAHDKLAQLAEERDWELAVNAGTLDAYQQFLAAHADGKWAQEARVRIESIQQASTPGGGPGASPGAAAPTADAPATTAVPPVAAPARTPAAVIAPAPKATAAQAAAPKAATPKPTHKGTGTAAARPKASRAGGAHLVQLGAFGSRTAAVAAWEKASARFPSLLGALQPRYATGSSGGKPIVRLQLRVGTRQQAQSICSQLKKQKQACVVAG